MGASKRVLWRRATAAFEPGCAALLVLADVAAGAGIQRPLALGLMVAACVGAGLSGRWPVMGSVVCCLGTLVSALLPSELVGPGLYAPMVCVIAAGSARMAGLATAVAAWGVGSGLVSSRRAESLGQWLPTIVVWVALYSAAGAVAYAVGRAREEGREVLVGQLEAQRRRIAAELHDNVASELSQIVMAAEVARARPERMVQELAFVAESGRRANQYLRNMMVLLRVDESFAPVDWADALADAEQRLTVAGRQVEVRVEGELADVPPSVADALACVTKEAATNILRHSPPGSACSILVVIESTRVDAIFTNVADGSSGDGLGVPGMEERVVGVGGSFSARPHGPLWVVRCHVPLTSVIGR